MSLTNENGLRIVVVSHDAGGAELLSSMVRHELSNYGWTIIAADDSPAKAVFSRKGLNHLLVQPEQHGNPFNLFKHSKPDYLFCGTGKNGFEIPYIREAQKQSICSVAFLDHWVNYRERFSYPKINWKQNIPDYVAVGDSYAYRLADELKVFNLLKMRNYYISDLLDKYKKVESQKHDSNTLLFISERIEECYKAENNKKRIQGFTETKILEKILSNFVTISRNLQIDRVKIRLHPAEPHDKYDKLLSLFSGIDVQVEFPQKKELYSSVVDSCVVVGITSMALFIAHLLDKPVISITSKRQKNTLPLPDECCINNIECLENIRIDNTTKPTGKVMFYSDNSIARMFHDIKAMRDYENSRHN